MGNETPDVSVIVVGFRDAEKIGTAIQSVLDQTLSNLEVIVVDDCSPDNTEDVVNEYVEKDPRVRFKKLDRNTGSASGPRNAGITMARAPWIMFVDSDDTLERHAVKNMLRAVEEFDADLGCGASLRMNTTSGREKLWWPEEHEKLSVYESITEAPGMVFDQLVTNKIFRREWLLANNMEFAEGYFYQDMLWMIQSYTLANRIVVIPETVHHWMIDRLADDLSVTQRRHEVANVGHRITMNQRMDEFLVDRPEIQVLKDRKFIHHDVNLYMTTLLSVDDDSAEQIMDQLVPYVQTKDMEEIKNARLGIRIAYFHLLQRDIHGLRKAMKFAKWSSVMPTGTVTIDSREYWRCSHTEDASAREWLDLTEVHASLIPFSQFRFLSIVDDVANGRASGVTTDPFGRIPTDARFEIALLAPGERIVALAPATVRSRDGENVRWEQTQDFSWIDPSAETGAWGVRIIGTPIIPNLTAARFEPMHRPTGEFEFGGSRISLVPYERGALGWRNHNVQPESKHRAPMPDVPLTLTKELLDLPHDRECVLVLNPRDELLSENLDLDVLGERIGLTKYLLIDSGGRLPVPSKYRWFAREVSRHRDWYEQVADVTISAGEL